VADSEPRLFADDRGIWREDSSGRPTGVAWDDVYRVSGHKLDGVTETYICVAIDWECGEFVELYQDWPGFPQVMSAITARLPGLDAGWFSQIEQLSINDPAIEIWRRA
jgi:hypothetical protein